MARFIIKTGMGKHQRLEVSRRVSEVGRGSDMDVVMPNVSVSRHHARLHVDGDEVRIEDVGSQNGVRVNGERLEPEGTKSLKAGDVVGIGKFELVLVPQHERFYKGRYIEYMTLYEAAPPAQQGATFAVPPAEAEAYERARRLIQNARVISDDSASRYWHPEDQSLTFGKNAMVSVPGGFLVPDVAAEITWDGKQHVIKKMGMVGKVQVNGDSIKAQPLRCGDDIVVGGRNFKYLSK